MQKMVLQCFLMLIKVIFISIVMSSDLAIAVRGITERDYMSEHVRRTEGFLPITGDSYVISSNSFKFPKLITFFMERDRSLLVRLESNRKHSSVIMLTSQASSPRLLKAVWKHDDIRYPITFWTGDYWLPESNCNPTGCPKVQFKVIKGHVEIFILDQR